MPSWSCCLRHSIKQTQEQYETLCLEHGSNPCVYIGGNKKSFFDLTYVNDIIASLDDEMTPIFKTNLSYKCRIKDLGQINYCLGLEICQTKDQISFCRSGYIFSRFKITESKPVKIPNALNLFD